MSAVQSALPPPGVRGLKGFVRIFDYYLKCGYKSTLEKSWIGMARSAISDYIRRKKTFLQLYRPKTS